MDFITYLPSSEGFDLIFTIVDRFPKCVTFISNKVTCTALDLARRFYKQISCKFGMPKKIGIVGFYPSSGRPSCASYNLLWQFQVDIILRKIVSQNAFLILLSRYSIVM